MIKEKLAKLLNVKSIISLALTGVFCWLAVDGTIEPNIYNTVFTTVIAFYFGTQAQKKAIENDSVI